MRFNAKEICAVASQPSYKFEKEGILFIKERQDGLFRRSDGEYCMLFRGFRYHEVLGIFR